MGYLWRGAQTLPATELKADISFLIPPCLTAALICSWCFCSWGITRRSVPKQGLFFKALGNRIRRLRKKNGYSQEDMISFGFSARHWQQVEAGRPITVTTLLRICEVFRVSIGRLVQGLDKGIYRN